MNKICTSLEQSKKLIELGIDIDTADMYWWNDERRYEASLMDAGFISDVDIPAWSLSAMLNALPSNLQLALAINDYQGDIKERYAIGSVNSDIYDCYADNPIDACYEMILKLHELKML